MGFSHPSGCEFFNLGNQRKHLPDPNEYLNGEFIISSVPRKSQWWGQVKLQGILVMANKV